MLGGSGVLVMCAAVEVGGVIVSGGWILVGFWSWLDEQRVCAHAHV